MNNEERNIIKKEKYTVIIWMLQTCMGTEMNVGTKYQLD